MTRKEQKKHQIPLNIVLTYPVRWGTYKIFRDYVQNFYDSVGSANWSQRFHYTYKDETLSMWVENETFSYEWLLHIGASTKTNSRDRRNAGFFGEGFKIASLCAVRDKSWNICMSSGNWTLNVIIIDQKIDEKKVKMLGYDVYVKEYMDESRLVLTSVSEEDYNIFLSAVKSFYYEDNPLLGEKIWEDKEGAIYTCNTNEYKSDQNLPYTYQYGHDGTVFCSYQLLGSNPFGLSFCLHDYAQQDRERNELYYFEVVQVIGELCTYLSSDAAVKILEKMRRYWNSVPKEIDLSSWAPVIRTLIVKISFSYQDTQNFRKKYPHLLSLPPVKTTQEKNRRSLAYTWVRQQTTSYLLVQVSFELLGYPSLEEECEKYGGFILDDNPNELENKCVDIIETLIKEIYGKFFQINDKNMPERKIISNNSASYHGMAVLQKRKGKNINCHGLNLKNTVCQVYLKKTVFRSGGFYDALSTYIHELCHSFGGDASQSFSLALTYSIEILMKNHAVLENYKNKWEELFQ